jgi:hypothetical protein
MIPISGPPTAATDEPFVYFLPLEGTPASLGPGLRTVSWGYSGDVVAAASPRAIKPMSEETPDTPEENQMTSLATALAGGMSARKWAAQNGVPERTASRWANSPEVRAMVEQIRRRAIDQAVGTLASSAIAAARGMTKLAKGASSESVQLGAQRAVLRDLIAVSDYNGLEYRMARIEEQLRARQYCTPGPG